MSPDPPPQPSLAVLLVIESSLTLAQEWPRPLFEYSTHLLKRLTDSHPGAKLRLGFVGYGTADTVPSPILCKRFFMEGPPVYKEMLEEPSHLGIGMTNSGGSRGMAVLEGIVAALELFDIIQGLPNNKLMCHIIHLAASAADNTRYPSWNDTMQLDDVDWESLPGEFKQRNISYSLLALRPPQGRLRELYAALNGGTTASPPWFNLRPSYTLLAAPLIAIQPVKAVSTSTKRPNDTPTNADRTPESKRPRLQSTTDSPKPTPTPKPATIQPPPPPQVQSLPQPPAPVPAVVSTAPPPQVQNTTSQSQQPPLSSGFSFPPGVDFRQVMQKLKDAAENLQKHEAAIRVARAEGNMEKAEALMRDYMVKKEAHEKMRMVITAQAAKHAQAQANPQQSQAQSQAPPKDMAGSSIPISAPSSLGGKSPGVTGPSTTQDIMAAAAHQHARTISGSTFPSNTPTMNPTIPANLPGPPNINLQMQKMLEQQQRARMTVAANSNMGVGGPSGGMPNQQNINQPNPFSPPGAEFTGINNMTVSSIMPPQQQQPSQGRQPPNLVVMWTGSLNWSGQGQGGKRDVQAQVIASCSNPSHAQPQTWPKAMVLAPAREQFSLQDLEMWIKHHQPAVCYFRPQSGSPDPQANDSLFGSLVQLLVSRKIANETQPAHQYATAAWTTPTGGQTRNAIFFPHPSGGLAAAVFPLTGLPDLPGSNSAVPPPIPANPMLNLPPQVLAQLQSLTPERRAFVMASMVRQRQQNMAAQQQQQQQLQGQPGMQSNANQGNMNAVLNMMNTQVSHQGGGPMMGMNPQGGTQPAMGGPGLTYDMFQSFVQRTAENGMNMGQKS